MRVFLYDGGGMHPRDDGADGAGIELGQAIQRASFWFGTLVCLMMKKKKPAA